MKAILCALVLAALAGPVPAAAASKAAPNLTDGQIQNAIRAKFARSKISAERFTVTVKDRIATIEGMTGVVQHKGVATRIARTSGAVAVHNHVQISAEAKTRAAAGLRRREAAQAPSAGRVPPLKAPTKPIQNGGSAPKPLARAAVIPER